MGQESRRAIRTKRIVPWGVDVDMAIEAHCYARGAHRTFLASRIIEFVNAGTGEVVDNIPAYLMEAYRQSPRGTIEAALDALHPQVTVLVAIARASGAMSPRERSCIRSFIETTENTGLLDDDVLKEALRYEEPNTRAFRAALNRAATLPDQQRAALLDAVDQLAAARKSKPDEITAATVAMARRQLEKSRSAGQ